MLTPDQKALLQRLREQAAGAKLHDAIPVDEADLRVLLSLTEDSFLLDHLEAQSAPNIKWLARMSTTGCGFRLHQDPIIGLHATPRDALEAYRIQHSGKPYVPPAPAATPEAAAPTPPPA